MTILRLKSATVAAALVVAGASAQAVTLLSEGFDSVSGLAGAGWVLSNQSAPVGTVPTWYQGDAGVFGSFAGDAGSYAASNYNVADVGGALSNWLITPTFATDKPVVVTFMAKADILAPYFDKIAFGFSAGGSTPGSFTLGSAVTVGGGWVQYTATLAAQGAGTVGRFAIQHVGAADDSNFVGVDSLTIAAVPEPATWLMLAAGMIGMAGVARRRQSQA